MPHSPQDFRPCAAPSETSSPDGPRRRAAPAHPEDETSAGMMNNLWRSEVRRGNRDNRRSFRLRRGGAAEAPGGGTTFGSPVLGGGFWMPGSTSFGWMTPFDWFSFLLRFSPGASGLAAGMVSFGAGLGAWANAAPATRVAAATIMQSRESMIRMALERVDVRTVPWRGRDLFMAAPRPKASASRAGSDSEMASQAIEIAQNGLRRPTRLRAAGKCRGRLSRKAAPSRSRSPWRSPSRLDERPSAR